MKILFQCVSQIFSEDHSIPQKIEENLVVIDVDINKSYDEEQNEVVRNKIISNLSDEDVVVRTGSGGQNPAIVNGISNSGANLSLDTLQEYISAFETF